MDRSFVLELSFQDLKEQKDQEGREMERGEREVMLLE